LKIVGWYQANQRNDDGTLHQSAIKVAETILQHNSKAIIFVVNINFLDKEEARVFNLLLLGKERLDLQCK
jgi:hypothetical protein